MKAKFSVILRVVVSAGLIAFLLWSMREHFPRIAGTLARTNLFLFASAVLLFMANVIILSLRLKILLAGEDLPIAFGRVIQLSYIGYFFNNFMPTAVGGDIVKAYYAHKQTKKTAKSFIAVFMDRFIGLFSFVCIAAFALFLSWDKGGLVLKKIVFAFTAAGAAGFVIVLNSAVAKVILKALSKLKFRNLGSRLSKVYTAVHDYRNKKGLILSVIGISIVTQSIYFSVVYLLARSVGADILPTTVFLVMPIVSVVSMLPSLGGLGLREGAIVALFGPMIGAESAFSISILLLATLLAVSLAGAAIYLFAAQFKIKPGELSKLDSYSV